MAQKRFHGGHSPQHVMTVEADRAYDGEANAEDCAVVVMGPRGAVLTVHLDGSVSGDPVAVEREAMAVVGVGIPLGRALLGLARLALRVSRPN